MSLFVAKLLELEDKIRFFVRRVALAEVRAADAFNLVMSAPTQRRGGGCTHPYQIFVFKPDGSIAVGATVEVWDTEDPNSVDSNGDFVWVFLGTVTVGDEGFTIFCVPSERITHSLRSRGSLAGYTSAFDTLTPGRIDLTP
jgi:hypothetical protein